MHKVLHYGRVCGALCMSFRIMDNLMHKVPHTLTQNAQPYD
jgi:hypothetical protein